MKTMYMIDRYDEFELPKTRKQITELIQVLNAKKQKLSTVDQRILNELNVEFAYDLNFSSQRNTSLFPELSSYDFLSEKEKYLFTLTDSSKFNLFANLILENKLIYSKTSPQDAERVNLLSFGGRVRATFLDNFGFMIQGTNGTHFGSKELAQRFGSLRYNYKFNYDKLSQGGVDFFDETEGYFLADWDLLTFKIGRDRLNIGYGPAKTIIGNNTPQFDYVSMNINYGLFGFSYFHGKLLGSEIQNTDTNQGRIRNITDKYLVYHRFAFNISKHFKLGLGETVVYSNRSIDFSYINPFNYYKSVEHANKDRDNSMLFIDLQNNSVDGINFYSTLLIDDIDFGKFGTSYYGNQFMLEAGSRIIPDYKSFPLEIDLNYVRVSPYTYSHRIYDNNFTNDGFALTDEILPNSESYYIGFISQLHHRVSLNINFKYTRHGANNSINGRTENNYGGDYLVGHRIDDPLDAEFLDGNMQHFRKYGMNLRIEPVNNYFIHFDSYYEISSLINSDKYENFTMLLIVELRI